MSASDLLMINPLLSDRARLAILATLAAEKGAVDFNTMIDTLKLSRGNFSTHARKLEEGGLIAIEKTFVERKPLTTYRITAAGKKELAAYLEKIEAVLRQSQE